MASAPIPLLTPERYLELDSRADRPSEYYDGEMFVIEAASARHCEIQLNLGSVLRDQLRNSDCRALGSPLRVRIPRGRYTYPDMVAACNPEYEEDDTLLNPVCVFEILSESTANFDLGRKFDMYRSIPSLMEYVVIEQHRASIRRYTRQPGPKWVLEEFSGLDAVLTLHSLGCQVPLSELYLHVDLDPET